jgi:hypothetical protein
MNSIQKSLRQLRDKIAFHIFEILFGSRTNLLQRHATEALAASISASIKAIHPFSCARL